MKINIFLLFLFGIWSLVMICSCKNKEINPIDNIIGYYSDGGIQDIKIEKKEGNNVSIKATRILYKRDVNFNGGFEEYYKDFEFPNCEIIFVDTVIVISGMNTTQNQFYAKIVNKDNKTLFGDITKWDSYKTSTKRNFYGIKTNNVFNIDDSLLINKIFIKWIN